ncbi:MAG TPA: SDR family oxidoreductase [Burkholderiales bacterium]|nr:SDR family oxidoreductase [Burkholderiales bacterium]
MLLENKNAVIYGGGGAIGGAVARAFAKEGATVFLAGRSQAKLDSVARDIAARGGAAETAVVDALDERAVRKHADAVAAKAGGIDITLNAVGIPHVQGPPLPELSVEDYAHPIAAYTRTNFLTAKAVASSACGPTRFPKPWPHRTHETFSTVSRSAPAPRSRPCWRNERAPARCLDAFRHSTKSRISRPSWHRIAPAR